MKKIVASVGLVALGASSLTAVHGQNLAATPPYKPWNVSASLRGFYDDNINGVPSGSVDARGNSLNQSSFGVQIAPAVGFAWQNDQTAIKAGYVYTLRYYEKKPYNNANNYDQNHDFNMALGHAFSERYRVDVTDSFVVGQEPDLLRHGYALQEPQRVSGDNIRNYGVINFNAQFTPLFGLEAGYANAYYDYHDKTPFTNAFVTAGNDIVASRSGTLDRSEHTFHLDGRFQMQPQTVGIVGYQFAMASYLGDEIISEDVVNGTLVYSKSRNYRAHYGYVGADHNFRPDFSGSIRVGARGTDYYNADESDLSPYVNASLQYNYAAESSATIGFSYDRNATDVTTVLGGTSTSATKLTLDAESAVLYG